MQIDILSRYEMLQLITEHADDQHQVLSKYKIVSIFDSEGPVFKIDHANLLNLEFADITPEFTFASERLFTRKQARQALEFLLQLKPGDRFIAHCAAGISRSGAVGTFAAILHKQNVQALHRRHPRVHPNSWVLQLLKEANEERSRN